MRTGDYRPGRGFRNESGDLVSRTVSGLEVLGGLREVHLQQASGSPLCGGEFPRRSDIVRTFFFVSVSKVIVSRMTISRMDASSLQGLVACCLPCPLWAGRGKKRYALATYQLVISAARPKTPSPRSLRPCRPSPPWVWMEPDYINVLLLDDGRVRSNC